MKECLKDLVEVVVGFFIVLIIVVGIIIVIGYINAKYLCTDKYTMNSPCFDMGYRCSVECGTYGLNFSGELPKKGCSCKCDDKNYVSACTGWLYTFEPERFNDSSKYEDRTNRTFFI